MNLAIDIGNTVIKIAIFSNNEIVFKRIFEKIQVPDIEFILEDFPETNKAILSSVSHTSKDIIDFFNKRFGFFFELNHLLNYPFKINYKTPETLGNDRIAAIAAANYLFPQKNVLVIDIGTAVTYDLLTENNEYIGGNISPGLKLRYRSLHEHTDKLPLLNISEEEILLGNSTNSAITAGVQNGLLFEIENYISKLSRSFKNLKIILTGGDSFLFEKKIKSTIFVHSNLVLTGLNRILNYNAKDKQN